MTTWTKVVVHDEQTDEYLIEFSEEELKQIGWQLGDALVWSDNKNGSWTLKKKEDKMGKFISTKTYGHERGFAVAYRQWKADTHCNLVHGYALAFHFEFECNENDLDARNWCVDFGGYKSLKERLDDWFDHTFLAAQDDPEFKTWEDLHNRKLLKMVVVERTGCEGLAKFLADYIQEIWMEENGYGDGRVKLRMVKVMETPSNSAMWVADHV